MSHAAHNSQKRVFTLERGEENFLAALFHFLVVAQFQLSLQDHGTHEMTMQTDKPRFLFVFVCEGLMEKCDGFDGAPLGSEKEIMPSARDERDLVV